MHDNSLLKYPRYFFFGSILPLTHACHRFRWDVTFRRYLCTCTATLSLSLSAGDPGHIKKGHPIAHKHLQLSLSKVRWLILIDYGDFLDGAHRIIRILLGFPMKWTEIYHLALGDFASNHPTIQIDMATSSLALIYIYIYIHISLCEYVKNQMLDIIDVLRLTIDNKHIMVTSTTIFQYISMYHVRY